MAEKIVTNKSTPVVQTPGLTIPEGDTEAAMEYAGLRYGSPNQINYATGRRKERPPSFPWPAPDDEV